MSANSPKIEVPKEEKRPKSSRLEFANFICTFGEDFKLLDFAKEIVVPAFEDTKARWKYMGTELFFMDVGIIELPQVGSKIPLVCLVGRLVRNKLLRSEQVFRDGVLEPNDEQIESAPSSVFVLILNSHKLLYAAETKDAPGMGLFRATAERFIRDKYRDWRRGLRDQLIKEGEEYEGVGKREAMNALKERVPLPMVKLIPIPTEDTILQFASRFSKLKTVTIEIGQTNDEINNEEFFDAAEAKRVAAQAETTEIIHHSSAGLNKPKVIEQITSAAKSANAHIKFEGLDEAGRELRGSNDNFKLQLPFTPDGSVPDNAERMVTTFVTLINDGIVSIQKITEPTNKLLLDVAEWWRNGRN